MRIGRAGIFGVLSFRRASGLAHTALLVIVTVVAVVVVVVVGLLVVLVVVARVAC